MGTVHTTPIQKMGLPANSSLVGAGTAPARLPERRTDHEVEPFVGKRRTGGCGRR
jgi:hypothetical protein